MTTLRRAFRTVLDTSAHRLVSKMAPRTHILLACMPKSGSTYLSNTISRLPDFRLMSLVSGAPRAEQEIDPRVAIRKSKHNYISHQHVRYHRGTFEAIQEFQLIPIVLVRNIFDCVVSLRDHWRRESFEIPMAYVVDDHLKLNDQDLDQMIVQMVIPWYINFFVSWTQCDSALWLRYEDVILDPAKAVTSILERAGHPVDHEAISAAVLKSNPDRERKNVGRPGRGASLPENQKEVIRKYRHFYPDIDFSPIGLG